MSVLRSKIKEVKQFCAGGNNILTSNLRGANYQWQLNTANGFIDILDNSNYSGSNTDSLTFNNVPSSWYGYQYRCIVDGNNSTPVTLWFTNAWKEGGSLAWEDPVNWSCGQIPDDNTDVIINSGNINLSSSTTIRSLMINPAATLTVSTGSVLTITH